MIEQFMNTLIRIANDTKIPKGIKVSQSFMQELKNNSKIEKRNETYLESLKHFSLPVIVDKRYKKINFKFIY